MATALGLLLARLAFGLAITSHGTQKLFGWFGGHGIKGTAGFFDSLGFPASRAMATAASLGEIVGGLLLALGWLGSVGPAIIIGVMIVAGASVHLRNGFFAQNGGYEMAFLYGAAALAFAFAGPGALSLDALASIPLLHQPATAWVLIALAVIGSLAILAIRRTPQARDQQA
ncbi:DoxX family protein [bacterium]|nr:MAG: DoxX family protein [bacterium]